MCPQILLNIFIVYKDYRGQYWDPLTVRTVLCEEEVLSLSALSKWNLVKAGNRQNKLTGSGETCCLY